MTAKKTNREYTYFIQQETGGNIKIGFTTQDPKARLANLQTGSAYNLRIVGLLEGNREKELHKKFSHINTKGEWYKNSEELVDYIRSSTLDGYDEPLVSSPKIDEQGYLKYETTKQVWRISPNVKDIEMVEFDWRFSKDQQRFDIDGNLLDDGGFFGLEEKMCGLGEEYNILNKMGFRDLIWSEESDIDEEEFDDRDTFNEPLCEFDVFRNICYIIYQYTDGWNNFGKKINFFKDVYINSDEWLFMVTCQPITSQTRVGYINHLADIVWGMDEFCAFHFFAYDDMYDRLYDLNEIARTNFFNQVLKKSRKSTLHDPIQISDLCKFLEYRRKKELIND